MARISTALPKGIAKKKKKTQVERKEGKKELNPGKIASSIAQQGKRDKTHKAWTQKETDRGRPPVRRVAPPGPQKMLKAVPRPRNEQKHSLG